MQNAPEKVPIAPPSPNFSITVNPPQRWGDVPSQVVANVECNVPPPQETDAHAGLSTKQSSNEVPRETRSLSSLCKSEHSIVASPVEDECRSLGNNSCNALELNIQEILALDVEYAKRGAKASRHAKVTDETKRNVYKSLPNLSASSENLLV